MIRLKLSCIEAQLIVHELREKQKEYNLASKSTVLKPPIKEMARLRANRLEEILTRLDKELDKGKL